MHFPDESYVRQYTRKTVNNRRLKWQGRAVLQAMLGEFDRAGIFELAGDPVECIAAVTDIPEEIVRFALVRLVDVTQTWTVTPTAIVWPTYVEAQTCAKSDRVRQQESRKRRAEQAVAGGAPRLESEPPSQPVTSSHEPSHDVTPSLADPEPNFSYPDRARARGEKEIDPNIEPERAPEPPPPTRTPVQTRCYPRGWRWSAESAAVARAAGVSDLELQSHVNHWTTRKWAMPVDVADLDVELQINGIPGIVARRSKASGASSPPTTDPYKWVPTDEHRAIVAGTPLSLGHAVEAYRAAKMPDRLGTFAASEDFSKRLRYWVRTGEFIAEGQPPKRERGAA